MSKLHPEHRESMHSQHRHQQCVSNRACFVATSPEPEASISTIERSGDETTDDVTDEDGETG